MSLPLSAAVEVLQDLNEFVVALDRLGSRQASGTAAEHTIGAVHRRLERRPPPDQRPSDHQHRD